MKQRPKQTFHHDTAAGRNADLAEHKVAKQATNHTISLEELAQCRDPDDCPTSIRSEARGALPRIEEVNQSVFQDEQIQEGREGVGSSSTPEMNASLKGWIADDARTPLANPVSQRPPRRTASRGDQHSYMDWKEHPGASSKEPFKTKEESEGMITPSSSAREKHLCSEDVKGHPGTRNRTPDNPETKSGGTSSHAAIAGAIENQKSFLNDDPIATMAFLMTLLGQGSAVPQQSALLESLKSLKGAKLESIRMREDEAAPPIQPETRISALEKQKQSNSIQDSDPTETDGCQGPAAAPEAEAGQILQSSTPCVRQSDGQEVTPNQNTEYGASSSRSGNLEVSSAAILAAIQSTRDSLSADLKSRLSHVQDECQRSHQELKKQLTSAQDLSASTQKDTSDHLKRIEERLQMVESQVQGNVAPNCPEKGGAACSEPQPPPSREEKSLGPNSNTSAVICTESNISKRRPHHGDSPTVELGNINDLPSHGRDAPGGEPVASEASATRNLKAVADDPKQPLNAVAIQGGKQVVKLPNQQPVSHLLEKARNDHQRGRPGQEIKITTSCSAEGFPEVCLQHAHGCVRLRLRLHDQCRPIDCGTSKKSAARAHTLPETDYGATRRTGEWAQSGQAKHCSTNSHFEWKRPSVRSSQASGLQTDRLGSRLRGIEDQLSRVRKRLQEAKPPKTSHRFDTIERFHC